MEKLKKLKIEEKHIKVLFILIVFIFCFITSMNIKFGNAPDEHMKNVICEYIEKYNKLPHGGDKEVRDASWGLSYGFTPVLSYTISAGFMKVVNIFTHDKMELVVAARFVSVLCYTGMAIMIILIGDKLFRKKLTKWLFIITVTCLPQIMFIGSYLNNDSLAMFSISVIIYSWILGLQSKWNYKSVIFLGVGIGICALSYYNAYGYILTSIILYICSYFINKVKNVEKETITETKNKEKEILEIENKEVIETEEITDNNELKKKIDVKNFLKKGILISIIALLLSGWWFVRSYMLYNGDFIGMNTASEYAEKYAIDELKPSKRGTPVNKDTGIFTMLVWQGWIRDTIKSFIGVFGNMSILMPSLIYYAYLLLYFLSFIGFIIYIVKNIKTKYYKKEKNKLLLEIIFTINIIITIFLSIYYSYFSDYQPQGRYIMPILIPMMYFVTKGITKLVETILNIKKLKSKIETKIKIEKLEKIIVTIIIVLLFLSPLIFLPRAWN